jgi:hypothetical protein
MAQNSKKPKTQNFYDRIADVHNVALRINGYRQAARELLRSVFKVRVFVRAKRLRSTCHSIL